MKKDLSELKQTSLFGEDIPFYKKKEKKEKVDGDRFDERNALNDLTGKQWLEGLNSYIYSDPSFENAIDKRLEKEHPESDSYFEFQQFIRFFTKEGMSVLDPFAGVGAVVKACERAKRISTAIELNDKWYCIASTRMQSLDNNEWSGKQNLINGDCVEELKKLDDENFDFVITNPPHFCMKDSKSYKFLKEAAGEITEEIASKDIGNITDYKTYIDTLVNIVFCNCARVLKTDKYMCIIVSDFRNGSEFMSMHTDLIKNMNHLNIDIDHELVLQGIKVILDDKKSLPYGYPYMYVENIHHRYVLIFKKVGKYTQIGLDFSLL